VGVGTEALAPLLLKQISTVPAKGAPSSSCSGSSSSSLESAVGGDGV